MNNEILTYLGYAAAFLMLIIVLSPVVSLLDRISFVVSSLTPLPNDIQAVRLYWFFVKNKNLLKKIEEKLQKGESSEFVFPIGKVQNDADNGSEFTNKEEELKELKPN